jgi:hypothetical protein
MHRSPTRRRFLYCGAASLAALMLGGLYKCGTYGRDTAAIFATPLKGCENAR